MNLTYALLIITVIIALFNRDRRILYISIAITNAAGLYQGIIDIAGLFSLGLLSLIAYLYFNSKNLHKALRFLLFIGLLILAAGTFFHVLPGFFNTLVLDKVRASPLSCPFSMYLNFDKVMAALIIYAFSNLHVSEKNADKESLKQTIFLLLLCIAIILVPALSLGYIKFDPKFSDILLLWAVNNLFFVSFAEEVIFRGFLQNTLRKLLLDDKKLPYLHIVIAALLFGLAHFKGGIIYVSLAAISGLFYGYVYYKTNRILCAMIVHFGLNLSHIMLFTYPAAISTC